MSNLTNVANSEDAIRARAYEIWESEGRPAGRDFDHWRRSELETIQAAAEPTPAPKPRAKAKARKSRAK